MSNVFFTITSVIYCIMLNIVYFSKERINSKENNIFSKILILTLFGVILEFISFCLLYNGINPGSLIYYFVSKFILEYYTLWGGLLLSYIIEVSKHRDYNKYSKIFFAVLMLAVLITPIQFKEIGEMSIPQGLSTNLVYMFSLMYIILGPFYCN